jgi:hypothetical protein
MIPSSLNLCGNGYFNRPSVRNFHLAGRRDKMLQNDAAFIMRGELVESTYSWFDASGSRQPGIAHQPHINLCRSTTPLAVKEVSIRSD